MSTCTRSRRPSGWHWRGWQRSSYSPVRLGGTFLFAVTAPPLLVAGRPVTVALHSWGNPLHTRLKRTVRSPLVTAPTWPPFATALYCTVVAGTHTPPIMDLVLGNDAVHDAEHVLYLVAGYLFFLPVLGTEPLRHRVSAIGAYLMLLIAMMADSATGVTYTFQAREAFTPYARGARAWGPNLVTDLHLGGDVMFIGSDLIMAVVAVALAARYLTADGHRLRPYGRAPGGRGGAMDLPAYNEYLQSLSRGSKPRLERASVPSSSITRVSADS